MRHRSAAVEAAAGTRSGTGPASRLAKLGAVLAISVITANCANQNVVAPKRTGGREVDPRYGVAASPRVIPDGQPIPKGGGRAMVGKPYVVAGRTYVPRENASYSREGLASWYGSDFHGRLTANGEIFDRESIAAAHATMPLPSYARVTNVRNGRSLIVRVNDRGPYHAGRLIDVSERAADALGFRRAGTTSVRVDYVGKASVHGSDDRKLLATLRDDGRPAGYPGGTAVAEAPAQTPRLAVFQEREVPKRPDSSDADRIQAGPPPAAVTPRPLARAVVATGPAAVPPPADSARATVRAAAHIPLPPERPPSLGLSPVNATKPVPAAKPRLAQDGTGRRAVAGVF